MPALRSVGPVPVSGNGLVTRGTADAMLTGMVGHDVLASKVDAAVAPYAQKSYVDTQDGLLATKAQVDAGDALLMPTSWKNAANGVCGLSGTDLPTARVPRVPVLPTIFQRSWYYNDFTPLAANVGAEGEIVILNASMQLPSNDPSVYYRFMCFGNFEGWALSGSAPYNNLSGKPVFRVYVNGYLCGYGAGRNGAGSAAPSPVPVTPVADNLGHVPGTGWTNSTATVRVTIASAFASTMVKYDPTPQTLLTIIVVSA
ncbi:hypothetical protein SEA_REDWATTLEHOG_196 [Gordonia phage RedWattleHog]|uniref:Uncharacterized protein n=1 Tax=Gordonia phage Stormageddon TaxID=2656541 RepID=A0A649VRC4_9CAUD|nr:minor tail protein [Gordonia phage Stormageddon]QGJ95057.1 hypothetical protein SEA_STORMAGEDDON_197 [Gordonia phage Stormageddon]QLF83699.1 hypothetical protein SEA_REDWATTLEHOG_196 [Gordonia phage RedWattleHog]